MTHRVVIVPGWRDSAPGHWQSLWAEGLDGAVRVEQDDWVSPRRESWVKTIGDLIHPNASTTATVRSVYFIDPQHKIRASLTYPASTGRNFDELVRVIDSLQLTDSHKVATPVNWKDGDDVVILPSIQDPAELAQRFPKGFKAIRPYLRVTPQPNK